MAPQKIKKGDSVNTKYGNVQVTSIELMPEEGLVEDGIEMEGIWLSLKDYCVFDLSNGHYARGAEVNFIPTEPSQNS